MCPMFCSLYARIGLLRIQIWILCAYQAIDFSENQFLDILATLETYRPQNLNIYIESDVESHFLIKNTYSMLLDRVFFEKHVL